MVAPLIVGALAVSLPVITTAAIKAGTIIMGTGDMRLSEAKSRYVASQSPAEAETWRREIYKLMFLDGQENVIDATMVQLERERSANVNTLQVLNAMPSQQIDELRALGYSDIEIGKIGRSEIQQEWKDEETRKAKATETEAKNQEERAAQLRSADVGEQGKAVNITGDLSAKITPAARQLGADLAAATGGQPKPPQPLKTTSTGTGKAAVNKVIPSSTPTPTPTRAEQAAQASLINRGGMGRSEAILPTPAEQAAQASLINRNETPTSEELLKQRRLRKNPFG